MLEKKAAKCLLMIDTDYILSKNIERLLIKHDYQMQLANNSENIPNLLNKTRFDLILLERDFLNNKGLYWLKWINNEYPLLPVVMASTRVDEYERLECLENGARDYLLKPFHEKELLIRMNYILRKEDCRNTKPLEVKIGNILFNSLTNSIKKDDAEIKLTLIEANILKILYLNAQSVVSRDEIMNCTKGINHNPLDRSIDIHINKIRKKLEDDPTNPLYISTIRGRGYRLNML